MSTDKGGLTLEVSVQDERVTAALTALAARMQNPTPAMRAIAETVHASIRRNFTAGGRPAKWPVSKRAKDEGGQTLIQWGVLKNSFNVDAGKDFAAVGTSDKRAGTHHFGAKRGGFGTVAAQVRSHIRRVAGKSVTVKAHTRQVKLPWGDIPARPFMLVQDEDWKEILAVLHRYLAET